MFSEISLCSEGDLKFAMCENYPRSKFWRK